MKYLKPWSEIEKEFFVLKCQYGTTLDINHKVYFDGEEGNYLSIPERQKKYFGKKIAWASHEDTRHDPEREIWHVRVESQAAGEYIPIYKEFMSDGYLPDELFEI